MAFDSQRTTPPSSIVGTRPFGLSARYSGDLFFPNSPPMSSRSNGRPISPQHHSTFCTLLDVFLPKIFNTAVLRWVPASNAAGCDGTATEARPPSGLGGLENADRPAIEKRKHVLDGVPVVFHVHLHCAVAEM